MQKGQILYPQRRKETAMPAEQEASQLAKKYTEMSARQMIRLLSWILKKGGSMAKDFSHNRQRFNIGEVGLKKLARSDLKIEVVDFSQMKESDLTKNIDIDKINDALTDDYIRFSWQDDKLYFYARDKDRIDVALGNLLKKMSSENGLKDFLKEEGVKEKAPVLDDKIKEASAQVQKLDSPVKDKVMQR